MPACRPTLFCSLLFLGAAAALGLAQAPSGKKYAGLIGINRYEHPKLKPLTYAEADVNALASVLRKAGYEVTVLTRAETDARLRPTRANILGRLKEVLRQCRQGDTVLVAFAGHGLQFEKQKDSDPNDAYFCPLDARPFRDERATLVSLADVYQELDKSFAGMKVLLVDACRDDPDAARGARGVNADSAPRPPQGVAALFSCRAGERAYEHDKLKHGIFFYHVLLGLEGAARDADGEVTFAGLAAYVSRRVMRTVPELVGGGTRQSPNLKADYSVEPILVSTHIPLRPRARPAAAVAPFPAARAREVQQAWAAYLGRNRIEELDLGEGTTMEFLLVPPGKFRMGAPATEEGRHEADTEHPVEITKPFYLGRYEVTIGQFRAFFKATSYLTDAEKSAEGGGGYDAASQNPQARSRDFSWVRTGWTTTDRHPVVNVSWHDAQAFCRWLSRKTGHTVRLPTEAEWEYACRAGTQARFASGEDVSSLRAVANMADASLAPKLHSGYRGWDFVRWNDGYPFTAPVGQFQPNGFGLHDMQGNAWEWVADWFHYYDLKVVRDPTGPAAGRLRVARGGCWYHGPREGRVARRLPCEPSSCNDDVGFRVVLEVGR
jgi:formylglycine-generating enzyme required for sulfatase activity